MTSSSSSSSSSSSHHTLPRLTVLLFSILVTLGSGTNYAYSAYAPQLGTRLNISHTQLNFVGLAGNLGVYTSGPLWGRIVDLRGPRILFLSATVLLFLGYSGIKIIYDAGIPNGEQTIETWRSVVLIGCGYMTGAGGNAGLTGSVNSVAKSFGEGSDADADANLPHNSAQPPQD
ncbi:hypothetical protein H0H93_013107 [Arthromyces matolae]|nr:hypothetical protein H0H93_013107 [Arthromyces matolae]